MYTVHLMYSVHERNIICQEKKYKTEKKKLIVGYLMLLGI